MPNLTPTNQAAADAPVNTPVTLVYLDVAGDPAWAWSGHGDLTVTVAGDPLLAPGRTFMGVGDIGSVGQIVHASDGSIQSMQLQLSQVDLAGGDVAAFVNGVSEWSQRRAVIWRAFARTVPGVGVLVDAPFRVMTARMVHVATVNGASASLTVKLATKSSVDGQRASGWRMADAHQHRFWPGDTAFSYIPFLMQQELRFGVRSNTPQGFVGDVIDPNAAPRFTP